MSKIKILHLSEIHFKKNKDEVNKTFRQSVQQRLIDTVITYTKEHGDPDFVVITGDIAFSGKKHEYDEALVFLGELKAVLPKETEFLAVPGNHDVDRSQVSEFFSIHQVVKQGKTDQLLDSPKDIEIYINSKFKSYRDFIQELNPGLYAAPADYFWVKNFKAKNVSFLGLNSAWASEGDDDRFNIALGSPQVIASLERSKEFSNRVVLMHHPPFNWLKDLESSQTRDEVFRKCRLILYGHIHSDNAPVLKYPANSCICLGANASYTNDKEGFIGFQFIQVNFSEKDLAAKVWPYIFDARRSDFVPDTERWPAQDRKPYFEISSFEGISFPSPILPPIPEDYKNWIREFHSILPVDQLARKGEVVFISLPEVYIPLETANPFYKPGKEREAEERPTIDIEELLGKLNCLLLRGNVGMGKTTVIKHLAFSLIHGSGPAALRGYLPVMVYLRDLWPIYKSAHWEESSNLKFESLLKIYLEKLRLPLAVEIVNSYLKQNRALFLLDGLDQVPGEIREDFVNLLHRFQQENRNNRFLITGRPHGIVGQVMQSFGVYLRDIEPLDDKKIEAFIKMWFRAVLGQARGLADVTAADMISEIRLHDHIAVFTWSPLLLTAVCILYQDNKRLPAQRADLYDRIVANLLYRRFHDPADIETVEKVREYLMCLGFNMQTRNIKCIDLSDAKGILQEYYPRLEGESLPVYKKRIEAVLEWIEAQSGLLRQFMPGEIEFFHLTFQEFLAAKHMLERDMDYKPYLEKGWWVETLLLYLGLMNLEMKKRSNKIVYEILDTDAQPRIQLLGARALRDFQPYKREESVVILARKKLIAIIESNASLEERFEAGEILGDLGDPRIDVLNPPMVPVEAGDFTRGSDETDVEKPICRVYLDEFMMGKYPVTNAEFNAFILDGGYENNEYWTPEGWDYLQDNDIKEPLFWHDRKWNRPNFPVVGVSWYEADAYVNWLSRKTGKDYSLPTESQWEKAARGSCGLRYPWGDEFDKNRCNSAESGLDHTSPVGMFHPGKSPYGCNDIAGNVWEWCSDGYGENPPGSATGVESAIRGGGFSTNAEFCRLARHFYSERGNRNNMLGFRLALTLHEVKLPLNKRVFKELISGNYLYVDKTRYIYNFFKEKGIYYFLSRPRRFGKSLMVSTLKELFSGNSELFKGLWIYDKIEWKKHPVIHIDFTSLDYENYKSLKESLYETLDQIGNEFGVQLTSSSYKTRFVELIRKLSVMNKVVVLIDEYDKPIIDHIETLSIAKGNRKILKMFYEVLKSTEEYLQFVFITGVSKFSKVSIFSGLNNLTDITFSDEFAALLGYTWEEMETYFDHEMARLAKVLNSEKAEITKNVKDWYNGYSWDGKSFVYNPFSILSLFKGSRFENYWFSSATPGFLINFIRESGGDVRDYDGITASSYLFEQYDIENIDVVSLLFQTGYLTAKERKIAPFSKPEYVLTYPNTEVRESFMVYLCHSYTGKNVTEVDREYKKLKESIHRDDLPAFFETMKSFFASIPYPIVQKDRESYYHLVIYLTMKAIGVVIKSEDPTNRGRIDAVLETPRNIYILEFKIGAAAKAMKQIKDKKYYEKYLLSSKPVKLVGVGFDTGTKNIRDYRIEEIIVKKM